MWKPKGEGETQGVTDDPIFGKVWHGTVLDETQINKNATEMGDKHLNESHGMQFPKADAGPVKMQPPKRSFGGGNTNNDERNPCDTEEFIAKRNAPVYPWMVQHNIDSPEYREMIRTGRAAGNGVIPTREYDDPVEQAGYETYGVAVCARAQGLPCDTDLIALHTNETRRPAYYAELREKKKKKL